MKADLADETADMLKGAGFRVSDTRGVRSCFDILARKRITLLVKVLANIEGVTHKGAHDLKSVANLTDSTPLIIGERMKSTRLMDGVVYSRYNVNVINTRTLANLLDNMFPHMYSKRGTYTGQIDPEALKALRHKLDMSMDELARELGISKQSIYRYEHTGSVSLENLQKIIDQFGPDIIRAESIFRQKPANDEDVFEHALSNMKKLVVEEFSDIGFNACETNAPFDVIAQDGKTIFSVVSNDSRRLGRKIDVITDISHIMEGFRICISNRRPKSDITVMKPKELKRVKDSKELFEMLKED